MASDGVTKIIPIPVEKIEEGDIEQIVDFLKKCSRYYSANVVAKLFNEYKEQEWRLQSLAH